MARYIDGPELFGGGTGVSTCGDFTCAICGVEYNKGNDETESYGGDPVGLTDFAGVSICEDCFEAVEDEILRRMPSIIEWYCTILKSKEKHIKKQKELLRNVFSNIQDLPLENRSL